MNLKEFHEQHKDEPLFEEAKHLVEFEAEKIAEGFKHIVEAIKEEDNQFYEEEIKVKTPLRSDVIEKIEKKKDKIERHKEIPKPKEKDMVLEMNNTNIDFNEEFVLPNHLNIVMIALAFIMTFVMSPILMVMGIFLAFAIKSPPEILVAGFIVILIEAMGIGLFKAMYETYQAGLQFRGYKYFFKIGQQGITIKETLYEWKDINLDLDDVKLLNLYINFNNNLRTVALVDTFTSKYKSLKEIEFNTKLGEAVKLPTFLIKSARIAPKERTQYSNHERLDYINKNYDKIYYPRMLKYLRAGLDGKL